MFVRQATMENQFVKQYPELMRGKKIMYVHGFGSSAQSGTVQMLRTLMPNATVVARDIPLHPEEGLQMLKAMAAEEQPDLIIGTSMGGMYTEMLTGFDRILVNPAFLMGDTMTKHGMLGKQTFQNPRQDGVQEFIVTKSMVEEYKEEKYRNNKDKAVMGSVSTLIWTLVLVAYFIISFNTGAWYITWVIFLIGGSIQSIVSLAYSLHKDKNGR